MTAPLPDQVAAEYPVTSDRSSAGPAVLEMRGIRKSFEEIEVLHGVDFTLNRGEVHALVGQNGAGKSTLMKILSGAFTRDEGEILIEDSLVEYASTNEAKAHGIAMVYQEFSLVSTLSVADNIALGREQTRWGLLDTPVMRRTAADAFTRLGVSIDPSQYVERLSIGGRQLVELAKAIAQQAPILVLDEPTASLTRPEIETLFNVIRTLRSSGTSIVYISHHLQEIFEVCDRVTILRDGRVIETTPIAESSVGRVVEAMIGQHLGTAISWEPVEVTGPPELEVVEAAVLPAVADVSFSVTAGEVLGIAGLLGSGRSELLEALLGYRRLDHGEIQIRGRGVSIASSGEALRTGIALVPEDRHVKGLVLTHSVRQNVLMSVWSRLTRFGLIDERRASKLLRGLIDRMQVQFKGGGQGVAHLSGGNQQKVVVARALSTEPKVLMLDEPTAGIDVKTKLQLMGDLRRIASSGSAVIFVSSDLGELAAVCDRVIVLRKGRVRAEFSRRKGDTITEAKLVETVTAGQRGENE